MKGIYKKRFIRGYSLFEILISIAIFSIVVAIISNFSSSFYKEAQRNKVKQDSQIMYNLFRTQLKQDLVEVSRDNVVRNSNTLLTLQYDMWNNGRVAGDDGKRISYESVCVSFRDYPVITKIRNFNNQNINNINVAIQNRIRQLGNGCETFNGCQDNNLSVIRRTERNGTNTIRTTYYPLLNTGIDKARMSGTISVAMCVPTIEDNSVRLLFLKVSFDPIREVVDIKEDAVFSTFSTGVSIIKR